MSLFGRDSRRTPQAVEREQARAGTVDRRGFITVAGASSVASALVGDMAGLVAPSPAWASANGASRCVGKAGPPAPGSVAGKPMKTRLPRTPDEFFAAMQERFNALDVATALTLFRPDAIFVDASGTVHRGITAIGAQLETYFGTGLQMDLQPRHVFKTGDTALSINDWSYDGKAKDGAVVRMSGSTSDVLRRCDDGVWRYLIDNPFGSKVGP